MECPCCKHQLSVEEYFSIINNRKNVNIPLPFSPDFVLKNHQTFHDRISSLVADKKHLNFFGPDDFERKQFNRPVLLQALNIPYGHEDQCDDCRRRNITLIDMKLNHIHEDHQISLWIVNQPQPTNLVDGTFYVVVRDQHEHHIRLIVSNWSYVTTTNELKSREDLMEVLNELLPVGSMIFLFEPFLTVCQIDGQICLRCIAPNLEFILLERRKKSFVHEKLDDLRERGNKAYIRGHSQLALDYYTFGINRILTMAESIIAKDNPYETDLFRNAFQRDVSVLHSNRSACYLREGIYPSASLDSLVVVAGRLFSQTYDEFYVKCLHRLICATIGNQEYNFVLNGFFRLAQDSTISSNLRTQHSQEFQRIQSHLPRLKSELNNGQFNLKQMFNEPSTQPTTFFDIDRFHSNFYNESLIKKRNNHVLAKRCIPAGTLLVVQRAFACVQTTGIDVNRRLINEIERHLIMSPTPYKFDLIRMMSPIDQWFENETDADEDDDETYPKAFPWGLLVKAQERNPYRSKSIVGWWPEISVFKRVSHSNQKGNCLWFICGETIFLFTLSSLTKNEELVIASNTQIRSFLMENLREFQIHLGTQNSIRLSDIFEQLERSQIYFEQ